MSNSNASTTPRYPGPRSAEMLEEIKKYVVVEPYPFVVDLENSLGMELATIDGQKLFDWAGYFGSKLIGHNHPRLYEEQYLRRLSRAANNKVANPDFLTPECLEYYRLLHRLAPVSMRNPQLEVYAINSGAEAVENMMKYLLAKFIAAKKARGEAVGEKRFLYFDQAFHGRNVYTLSVTQTLDPVITRNYHELLGAANLKLPFPSHNASESEAWNRERLEDSLAQIRQVLESTRGEVVAIITEPLQGAGGQRVADPEFWKRLSALAHEFDVPLAFDEVQTGLGATGRVFAIDHFELAAPPLAVAVGKKFGCGAVYMLEPLEELGVLDSTWGGTLSDMVRVVQEMRIVEDEDLIEAAGVKGAQLRAGLEAVIERHRDLAFNVRGMGLYQGFTLRSPELKARMVEIAREEFDLLLLGAGAQSIRTRPNLSVSAEDVTRFLTLLESCFARLAAEA